METAEKKKNKKSSLWAFKEKLDLADAFTWKLPQVIFSQSGTPIDSIHTDEHLQQDL
jgi:hypothetical protein